MQTLLLSRLRRRILPLLVAPVLIACSANTSQDGPSAPDGSLTVSPASFTLAVGTDTLNTPAACDTAGNGADFPQFSFLISTFDANGQPRGNVDIDISLDWAGNTTTGIVGTFLIDGDTGVIVSNPGDAIPYQTKTDDIGNKRMRIAFLSSPSCTFAGNMIVTSGNLFNQMSFTVTE